MKTTFENALDFAGRQMRRLIDRYPADYYPMYTVGGKFGRDTKRWTHWCDGFTPGVLFVLAEETGDTFFLDQAVKRTLPLEPRQVDRAVHDLGFLFFSTHLRWRELGGPQKHIDPVLHQAGRTMAMRFMERGQYLRSFVEPASLFIDIMMNVGTLFLAGAETHDEHLLAIAHRHCETSRRVLVRGDGSTAHEALFDLDSGECLRQSTHQGYRGDSCWSRGLAWSLYGFARSARQSGYGTYEAVARANADYLLAHAPDGITPWDFDAPPAGPLARTRVDTSASAIAAAGLLHLANRLDARGERLPATRYRAWALDALQALCRDHLGDGGDGFEGILRDGVYHIHKGLGVGEAVAFGDYFFVEALQKALEHLRAEERQNPLPRDTTAYPEDTLPASARVWTDGPTEEEMPAPTND